MLRKHNPAISDLGDAARLAPGSALASLVEALDTACAGPSEVLEFAVADAMGRGCLEAELLALRHCRGHAERYARHLLHADPAGRYTLVALVWEPGQFSPVHSHYTWCSYGVVAGALQESDYGYVADIAMARPLRTTACPAGTARFSHAGLDEIHCLGNAGDRTAISVHAYGVDGARVATHVNRLVRVAA